MSGRVGHPNGNDALLQAMREAFSRRDFGKTLAAFQRLSEIGEMPRDVRTEASSLAARALIYRESRRSPTQRLRARGGAGRQPRSNGSRDT